MNLVGDNIIQLRASDVMPGDCIRIEGCWETVQIIGGGSNSEVRLFTQERSQTYAPTAAVECAIEGEC